MPMMTFAFLIVNELYRIRGNLSNAMNDQIVRIYP